MSEEKLALVKSLVSNFKTNRQHSRSKFPESIKQEIIKLQKMGYSVGKLCAELELSYDSVNQWIGNSSYRKDKFKEVKITSVKSAVEKSEVFHILISKNNFEIKITDLTTNKLKQILEAL